MPAKSASLQSPGCFLRVPLAKSVSCARAATPLVFSRKLNNPLHPELFPCFTLRHTAILPDLPLIQQPPGPTE